MKPLFMDCLICLIFLQNDPDPLALDLLMKGAPKDSK